MDTVSNFKQRLQQSISIKLLVIAFLLLILQIPLSYVRSLIYERQSLEDGAAHEISQRWGSEQHIGAPMAVVKSKYQKLLTDSNGMSQTIHKAKEDSILAESFNLQIQLDAQKRYLGIYEVPVFTAYAKLSGTIRIKPEEHLGQINDWQIDHIFIPIKQMKGIKNIEYLKINGQKASLAQQQKSYRDLNGLSIDTSQWKSTSELHYEMAFTLTGSNQMGVIPLAGQTQVEITSNWSSPSFVGDFLPEAREITEEGFIANWSINELNHNFGRVLSSDKKYSLANNHPSFGTKIIIPANVYQVNQRTVKYGILIMLLTFSGFFLAEILFGLKLHPFQYLLIGFSLTVFYLLLLAISEYLHFNWAFLISSLAVISLIASYCSVILAQIKRGIFTGVLFALLYGFIFIMVKAEESSLLMGAIVIWIFLAAVMYLTRKINWYQTGSSHN